MRRIHFFEIFIVVNLIAIALLARGRVFVSPVGAGIGFFFGLLIQALAGIVVRSIIALVRRDREYFRVIRSGAWIADTLRLLAFSSLMIFTYGWIKLLVPVLHPRLFDQALWDLDRVLFFGLSPSLLFLDLFSSDTLLRAFDWSYANIFYFSAFIAMAYFFSEPSRSVRVAFVNGNTAMWLIGAWLYMLVPSIGPAYRFFDVWMPHRENLQNTQILQALLMRNYQNVLRVANGENPTDVIRIVFGIAAFPSLHVGFQMYVFLWLRRLWTWGEVLFAFFVLVILAGSMVTGWHYLIDGIAGIVLGWACYAVAWRSVAAGFSPPRETAG